MASVRNKAKGVGRILVVPGISRMRSDTLMTADHTVFLVRISRIGRAGIGRSSWEGLNTGRHVKAPVGCPCRRLAALHGAP